jgi:hypothetical protein
MPTGHPAHRKPAVKPDAKPGETVLPMKRDPDPKPDRKDGELCGKGCFPNGWPAGAVSAGCSHGTFAR